MSEITKLYDNAEVKKQILKVCSSNELYCKECEAHIENAMPYCKNAEYPPFTAEKQLELIKRFIPAYPLNFTYGFLQAYPFDEGLAYRMNSIWEKFTPKDKQQIKEVLSE